MTTLNTTATTAKASFIALDAISTDNASVKQAITLSKQRMTDNAMTAKAEQHLVTFCQVASTTNIEFDAKLVLANVYAVEKAKKIIRALELKSKAFVDQYTHAVTYNALKRTKQRNLTNAEMNATLCASLECATLTATMQKLHKAESTATTQASSSRVALQHLNIATNDKIAKTVSFNDTDNAKAFIEMMKA